ncbi:MAG: UGSC family (seleno)protein, partial [Burkholderiales bacterium]
MTNLAELLKSPGASLECEDDFDAVNDLVRGRGWSDGLPVVPPTTQRVEQLLAYCDRPWDAPVAKMAPRYGEATPLRLAANAVMAGCRPEYFPLLVLAVEAMCEEQFNLYGIQATTHLCAPLVIVNGPVAKELDINSGHNAFGPGWQANATIGRAIRLIRMNVGGGWPGRGDMATQGSPAKFAYAIAEREDSPWEPLHVALGFKADQSVVTVFGGEGPHNVNDHVSTTAPGILNNVADVATTLGSNVGWYLSQSQLLVVLGPEHAQTIAKDEFTRADVQRFIFEHARLPLRTLK